MNVRLRLGFGFLEVGGRNEGLGRPCRNRNLSLVSHLFRGLFGRMYKYGKIRPRVELRDPKYVG